MNLTMVTNRKFAHFKRNVTAPRIGEIPEGGFCISAFVIISRKEDPSQVLMGHLNKNASWDHIGGLDPERVERHSRGWMLPSSGLLYGETPQDAAHRILAEQLELKDQEVEGPWVFSEVYGDKEHWDIEFVFLGVCSQAPSSNAWNELKFVDLRATRREDVARSHEDILAHVGRWKN
jgi:ADP-ribose pyrophosphatase YjhB (NUDIX family)